MSKEIQQGSIVKFRTGASPPRMIVTGFSENGKLAYVEWWSDVGGIMNGSVSILSLKWLSLEILGNPVLASGSFLLGHVDVEHILPAIAIPLPLARAVILVCNPLAKDHRVLHPQRDASGPIQPDRCRYDLARGPGCAEFG